MERNNRDLKQCDICNKEISKSNWSKHIKTKKHLDNILLQRNNQMKYKEIIFKNNVEFVIF